MVNFSFTGLVIEVEANRPGNCRSHSMEEEKAGDGFLYYTSVTTFLSGINT